MYTHAQRRLWQKEADGEIFSSEPDASGLIIIAATGPNDTDYRRRCAWNPNIEAADRNRADRINPKPKCRGFVAYASEKQAITFWTRPEDYLGVS
jgi:hypothetical protein